MKGFEWLLLGWFFGSVIGLTLVLGFSLNPLIAGPFAVLGLVAGGQAGKTLRSRR